MSFSNCKIWRTLPLLTLFTAAAVCSPARAETADTATTKNPITHVVIIFQENRTPDTLFHGLRNYLPDADIRDSGLNSRGETVKLLSIPLATTYDLGHGHPSFVTMFDNGKMDGADHVGCTAVGQAIKCPPQPQFRYANPRDVKPYFTMAINYGFANRMFQTNQGPSFPSHQIIFTGTSQANPEGIKFASSNMVGVQNWAGCAAPPDTRVEMIGPAGNETSTQFPCFEHKSLSDLLDKPPGTGRTPVSWRFYTSKTPIWEAPNAIRHICKPSGTPPKCSSAQFENGYIVTNPFQVRTDIENGDLPGVSWVIPPVSASDHPGYNDGSGPDWVTQIVNDIGKSAYWKNTAIFITWDDWGGWYDHVKPPKDPVFGYYEYGFRVPLLVLSAYTPKGYVSQKTHDFGSILHFTEKTFDLGFIPPGNFADARADDLMDFFDFSMKPRAFVPISSAGLLKTKPQERDGDYIGAEGDE